MNRDDITNMVSVLSPSGSKGGTYPSVKIRREDWIESKHFLKRDVTAMFLMKVDLTQTSYKSGRKVFPYLG